MSILDMTGGAILTRMYRRGGASPLAFGLLALLGYRAYQNRARLTDMLGGAVGGIGRVPAMILPMLRRQDVKKTGKPARKAVARKANTRKRSAKSNGAAPGKARRNEATAPTVH